MSLYENFNKEFLIKEIEKAEKNQKKANLNGRDFYQTQNIEYLRSLIQNDSYRTGSVISFYNMFDDNPRKLINENRYNLNTIKDFIPSIRFFLSNVKDATDTYNILDFSSGDAIESNYNDPTNKIEELLTILHDFYNSLCDEEIKKKFNKIFKNRINNLRFYGHDSYMVPYRIDKKEIKSLITIDSSIYYYTLPSLAHEYGHAIDYSFRNYDKQERDVLFDELISTFFEFVMGKYMIDNNLYSKHIPLCEREYLLDKIEEIVGILIINKVLGKTFNNDIEFYEDIKSLEDTLNGSMKSYHVEDLLEYSLPYTLVIELLSLYKKDPESALYILKETASREHELNNTYFESKNIYIGEHAEEYVKSLSLKLKNVDQKKQSN